MINPKVFAITFFTLILIVLVSCKPNQKKDLEIIKEELEIITEEEVIEEAEVIPSKTPIVPKIAAMPFELVQNQPVFPGCIQNTQTSKNLCFKKKVKQHIEEKLPIADFLKQNVPVGYHKVPYSFIISKSGHVKQIAVDGNRIIAQNIKQSLSQLPKLQAGTDNNQLVAVKFADEINFYVGKNVDNGEVDMEVDGITIKANIPSNLTMHMVDRAPIFPSCEAKTGVTLIKCTSAKINNFIGNNINHDNLKGKNLPQGKQKIKIYFTITKQGSIADVSVQNKYEILKNEVIRVVNNLPKMTPALYERAKVPVNYHVTLTTNIKMAE